MRIAFVALIAVVLGLPAQAQVGRELLDWNNGNLRGVSSGRLLVTIATPRMLNPERTECDIDGNLVLTRVVFLANQTRFRLFTMREYVEAANRLADTLHNYHMERVRPGISSQRANELDQLIAQEQANQSAAAATPYLHVTGDVMLMSTGTCIVSVNVRLTAPIEPTRIQATGQRWAWPVEIWHTGGVGWTNQARVQQYAAETIENWMREFLNAWAAANR